MDDDTQDHLRISTRIDSVQMAKLMMTQGFHDRALSILSKLTDSYKNDPAMRKKVADMIAECEAESSG